MASALVIMVGSRGDHEPMLALATAMVESPSFSRVHVVVQSDCVHLIPVHPNIVPHHLKLTNSDLISTYFSAYNEATGTELERQQTARAAFISILIAPTAPTILQIAQEAHSTLIVGSSLIGLTAACVAHVLCVPMTLVNLQPNTPTSAYPFHMLDRTSAIEASAAIVALRESSTQNWTQNAATAKGNLRTYRARVTMHLKSLTFLNTFREEHSLTVLSEGDVERFISGTIDSVHILNAYPRHLVPPSPHWPCTVHNSPSLAAGYIPPAWSSSERCPKLVNYLAKGLPPICISFGSMPLSNATMTTRALLTACRTADAERVLIIPGVGDLGTKHLPVQDGELLQWADENVYVAEESVQYSWLLPRCRALVCHGGAGTVGAAVYAGIPLVVAPYGVDQYFWGDLVQRIGIGAVTEHNLQTANAKAFAKAIKHALRSDCIEQAAEMGKQIRDEGNGAKIASEILGKIVCQVENTQCM